MNFPPLIWRRHEKRTLVDDLHHRNGLFLHRKVSFATCTIISSIHNIPLIPLNMDCCVPKIPSHFQSIVMTPNVVIACSETFAPWPFAKTRTHHQVRKLEVLARGRVLHAFTTWSMCRMLGPKLDGLEFFCAHGICSKDLQCIECNYFKMIYIFSVFQCMIIMAIWHGYTERLSGNNMYSWIWPS